METAPTKASSSVPPMMIPWVMSPHDPACQHAQNNRAVDQTGTKERVAAGQQCDQCDQ